MAVASWPFASRSLLRRRRMTETKDTAAHFVSAFNAHDEKELNLLHADHIKFEAPGGFKATTAHAATAYSAHWFNAFPNGKMTVHSEIVSALCFFQAEDGIRDAMVLEFRLCSSD